MVVCFKDALKASEITPGNMLSVQNFPPVVLHPWHIKNVPFLTWTLTGSIQCSRVSAVMFSGRITGSLGGITHDGEHTAPGGTEIYSRDLNFLDRCLFHSGINSFDFLRAITFYVMGHHIIMVIGRADIHLLCTCRDTSTLIAKEPLPQVNSP